MLEFKDLKPTPDIIHNYTSSLRNNAVPIVIDNGNVQSQLLKITFSKKNSF